ARAAGQSEFGENYVQEALAKRQSTQQLHGVIWHFTGTLQANKTRLVAENFDWVHTVDRRKIAQRLNDQRPSAMPPLNVCIEVNLGGEASKSGIASGQLAALAEYVSGLPRLRLRGLMALPAVATGPAEPRQPFRELRQLLEALNQQGHALDTLSMGMSADFEAAIMEGATLVRLGTAVFGARSATRS
ncbi:MAG: YggS family pyridoxal phosphate-dependent enzyme, partial [Gammaproteobacteria bacterium]